MIKEIVSHNHREQPHSSLSYLWPVQYHHGSPETLLADHRQTLRETREVLKRKRLKLRKRLIP